LPASENKPPEQPQHNVTVAKPLAVSKYEQSLWRLWRLRHNTGGAHFLRWRQYRARS
jgi:hypothetical protein